MSPVPKDNSGKCQRFSSQRSGLQRRCVWDNISEVVSSHSVAVRYFFWMFQLKTGLPFFCFFFLRQKPLTLRYFSPWVLCVFVHLVWCLCATKTGEQMSMIFKVITLLILMTSAVEIIMSLVCTPRTKKVHEVWENFSGLPVSVKMWLPVPVPVCTMMHHEVAYEVLSTVGYRNPISGLTNDSVMGVCVISVIYPAHFHPALPWIQKHKSQHHRLGG